MTDNVKRLLQLLIIMLLMFAMGLMLGLLIRHGKHDPTETVTVVQRDTLYRFLPQPVTERIVEVPASVDTAAILQSYYTERIYRDTVTLPATVITLTDTVYHNRIIGRTVVTEQWRPPIFRKRAFGLGAHLSRELTAITANIRYDRHQFGLGYDLRHKGILATYQHELFRW